MRSLRPPVRQWGRAGAFDAAPTPRGRRISIRQPLDRARSAPKRRRSRSASRQDVSCFVRSLNLDEILVFGNLVAHVLVAPDQKLEHFAGAAVLSAVKFTLQT